MAEHNGSSNEGFIQLFDIQLFPYNCTEFVVQRKGLDLPWIMEAVDKSHPQSKYALRILIGIMGLLRFFNHSIVI